MYNPIVWLKAKWSDMVFRHEYRKAPIKILGELLIKEVQGNSYVVGMVDDIKLK